MDTCKILQLLVEAQIKWHIDKGDKPKRSPRPNYTINHRQPNFCLIQSNVLEKSLMAQSKITRHPKIFVTMFDRVESEHTVAGA